MQKMRWKTIPIKKEKEEVRLTEKRTIKYFFLNSYSYEPLFRIAKTKELFDGSNSYHYRLFLSKSKL
jgi:hypothetical protein